MCQSTQQHTRNFSLTKREDFNCRARCYTSRFTHSRKFCLPLENSLFRRIGLFKCESLTSLLINLQAHAARICNDRTLPHITIASFTQHNFDSKRLPTGTRRWITAYNRYTAVFCMKTGFCFDYKWFNVKSWE